MPSSTSSRASGRSRHSRSNSRPPSRHSRRSASPTRRGSSQRRSRSSTRQMQHNGRSSSLTRDDSALSDSLSSDDARPRRKSYREGTAQRKPEPHPMARPARHFGRTVEMWRRFETILSEGYACQESEPYAGCLPEQIPYIRLYKELVKKVPALPSQIEKEDITNLASHMETARSNARGEDVKRIKDNLQTLRQFNPPIDPLQKVSRGFAHPEIGRLLVKAVDMKKWDDDAEYRRGLIEGRTEVSALDYPLFLYKDEQVTDNLLEGFLRNDLLVRAFRAIFLGLSAVNGKGTSGRATKKGNAQLNNMSEVTIPAISYVATIVYFALSTQPTFTAGGDHGHFDFNTFYRAIIDLLLHPASAARRTALLAWWTQQIFPNVHSTIPVEGDSVHARMMAQLLDEANGDEAGAV